MGDACFGASYLRSASYRAVVRSVHGQEIFTWGRWSLSSRRGAGPGRAETAAHARTEAMSVANLGSLFTPVSGEPRGSERDCSHEGPETMRGRGGVLCIPPVLLILSLE